TLGGSANSFRLNERVLLIQMAGAVIDTSESDKFGSVTNDNGAGRYVWATVLGTSGQEVKLSDEDLRGFDAKNGKVQLVRAYSNAGDVIVNGRIEAQAWDGASGGVIAIEAAGSIDIAADVDASGKGFLGGPMTTQSVQESRAYGSATSGGCGH